MKKVTLKKVTRIRVERVEVPEDWTEPTPEWVAGEPQTAKHGRMADFYFTDSRTDAESSEIWPVLFHLDRKDAELSIQLLGQLFEMAGTMIRFSRLANIKSGRLPRVDD